MEANNNNLGDYLLTIGLSIIFSILMLFTIFATILGDGSLSIFQL